MRNFKQQSVLIMFLLLGNIASAFSCSCELFDVKKSYDISNVIFYGKFLGTDTIKNFTTERGKPIIVDNFEVSTFYRGVSKIWFDYIKTKTKNYRISLVNNCDSSCGICFEKEKMYLVYAYLDKRSGQLITDGCTRTREIINKNFISTYVHDPDKGKDENLLLKSKMPSDPLSPEYFVYYDGNKVQNEAFYGKINKLEKQLTLMTISTYLLSGLVLILFFGLIYFYKKKLRITANLHKNG